MRVYEYVHAYLAVRTHLHTITHAISNARANKWRAFAVAAAAAAAAARIGPIAYTLEHTQAGRNADAEGIVTRLFQRGMLGMSLSSNGQKIKGLPRPRP